jgi:hypothetical protein
MPFDYTGSFSGSFFGDITASNGVVSSSSQVTQLLPGGVVSSSAQVDYRNLQNKPTTISAFQRNSITANNHFRETTYPTDSASFDSRIDAIQSGNSTDSASFANRISTLESAEDATGSDAQTLSFNQVSNTLSISNGNSVDLSTLAGGGGAGGSSIWSTGSDYYYVNADLQVTGSFKVSENVIATSLSGAIDWSNIENTPSGLISGAAQLPSGIVSASNQITSVITDSYISASAAASGFGAGGDSIPSGTISSSQQITDLGFISSSHTDVSALNAFTSSIQSEVDSLTAATSSYLTSLPSGVVSGSTQITDVITDSYISASAAASGFGAGGGSTDISALNTFTGSIQSEVDSLTAATSSYLTEVPSGTLSGSAQVEAIIDDTYISASAAASGFGAGGGEITYVSESGNLSLSQIEVADFDDNVAVTFVGGKLKFIFGSPTVPSSLNSTLSGFATDRFNKVTDGYAVNGSWNNGGYTLISASLFEGATLLTQVGSGTSLSYSTTTSGSHTYKLEYTASSPLDGTIYTSSDTVSGNLSKSNPGNPSINATPSVQLGASSNQIEQGATGSITFSLSYGSSNSWEQVSLSSTPTSSPIYVTGSATGSSSIVIEATAEYQSPAGDNDPQISSTRTSSTTYSKIRSVRYGASAATSFTQSELEDLSSWDTSLGGSIGTIDKGNTNPSGDTITITWTGNKYHYIVFDSSRSDLTNITTSGFGVFASFTKSVVGNYKVYRSNDLQSDSGGGSITYVLT